MKEVRGKHTAVISAREMQGQVDFCELGEQRKKEKREREAAGH